MRTRYILPVLSLLLLPASAAAQMPMHGMAMAHASPADQDMQNGMARMDKDMAAVPMTGDADHDFVAMMIPHHEGAVDMAETELKYGKDPAIRQLAASIVAAQKREIAEMRDWQKTHQAP